MIVAIIVALMMPMLGIVLVLILNPHFWQGLRNSKYLDEQFKKLRDQDNNSKEVSNEQQH